MFGFRLPVESAVAGLKSRTGSSPLSLAGSLGVLWSCACFVDRGGHRRFGVLSLIGLLALHPEELLETALARERPGVVDTQDPTPDVMRLMEQRLGGVQVPTGPEQAPEATQTGGVVGVVLTQSELADRERLVEQGFSLIRCAMHDEHQRQVGQRGGKVRMILAVQSPLRLKALAGLSHGLVLVLASECGLVRGFVRQTSSPSGSEAPAEGRLSSQNDEPRGTTASRPFEHVSLAL